MLGKRLFGELAVSFFSAAVLCLESGSALGQVDPASQQVIDDRRVASFPTGTTGSLLILSFDTQFSSGPPATGSEFVLDSGASFHCLDNRYRPRLERREETERIRTAGAPIECDLYKPPSFGVGKLDLTGDAPAVTIDFQKISAAIGQDIHGILGMTVFLNHIVVCDFDRGFFELHKAGKQPGSPTGEAITLHITKNGQSMHVMEVKLAGKEGSLLLDTGSNASITLNTRNFDQLSRHGLITSIRSTPSTTASGVVQRRSGRLHSIQIGPFTHRSLSVSESTNNSIGLGYLRRFHVTIDAANRTIHLAKGRSYEKPDLADASGTRLLWVNNQILIEEVANHSPAQRAGVQAGDILLKLNGRQASGSCLCQLRQMLSDKPGEIIHATLLRDGKKYSTQFELADYGTWGPREQWTKIKPFIGELRTR